MSMIERVARAIYDELEGPVSNQDYVRQTQQWERSQKLARAAIEAMREPTTEMLQDGHFAARSARMGGAGGQTVENSIRMETKREAAAWPAMIDAALSK